MKILRLRIGSFQLPIFTGQTGHTVHLFCIFLPNNFQNDWLSVNYHSLLKGTSWHFPSHSLHLYVAFSFKSRETIICKWLLEHSLTVSNTFVNMHDLWSNIVSNKISSSLELSFITILATINNFMELYMYWELFNSFIP